MSTIDFSVFENLPNLLNTEVIEPTITQIINRQSLINLESIDFTEINMKKNETDEFFNFHNLYDFEFNKLEIYLKQNFTIDDHLIDFFFILPIWSSVNNSFSFLLWRYGGIASNEVD